MREIKYKFNDGSDVAGPFSLGDKSIAWYVAEGWTPREYTGMKDKNGIEIYEGDIVRITTYEGEAWNATVVYQYGSFDLRWPDDNYEDGVDEFPVNLASLIGEVIGNIYEIPQEVEG